ncbi:MAG: substrate-binding domain-containing protein, partial [Oscillospiraceae bacterium]|nr:substrate-binding domain-containing protein [Oscillospiraceae bacterium]
MKKIFAAILAVIFSLLVLGGCSGVGGQSLRILSGSENRELEPVLAEFTKRTGVKVEMSYKGSIDIMNELRSGVSDYDAVWPANSIWIAMGDDNKVVKHEKSIMSSPIVFGLRKSLAQSLGFVGRQISVKDILTATENGTLRFAMTSATQSNSGACAYLGFLSAMLDKNTPVTAGDLQNADLQADVKKLLSGVNRSSGSSDWLKELLVENPDSFDAMVNYESLVIAANMELTAKGKEPLYIIYPYDGMSLSDSPLGYVGKGGSAKEEAFLKLQEYLLSDAVQKNLNDLGRRTGITLDIENPDPKVWNKDWGVDTERTLSFINLPPKEVIFEALNLYQTALKKPSATVYCLDYSGSMSDSGNEQLVEAMHTILDQ